MAERASSERTGLYGDQTLFPLDTPGGGGAAAAFGELTPDEVRRRIESLESALAASDQAREVLVGVVRSITDLPAISVVNLSGAVYDATAEAAINETNKFTRALQAQMVASGLLV